MKIAAIYALALLVLGARAAAGTEVSPPAGDEPVVGLSFRGVHRAYPGAVFSPRRVINDVIGQQEVAVFHDPDSGLSTAWFRTVFGEPIEFSGEASGTVVDDLTTVTRWDMSSGAAIGGSLAGQRLIPLPVTWTSWSAWRAKHPAAGLYAPPQQ